jgi:hypothetical protein
MYPVEVAYLSEPTADYVETAVQTIFDIHARVRPTPSSSSLAALNLAPLLQRYRTVAEVHFPTPTYNLASIGAKR